MRFGFDCLSLIQLGVLLWWIIYHCAATFYDEN